MDYIKYTEANQLPEDIRPKPLKKGEVAIFRLYNSYNPITKEHQLMTCANIPETDVIADKDGNLYNIGYVTRYMPTGEAEFGEINLYGTNLCQIMLKGDSIKQKKLAEFLRVVNFNFTNSNRDKTIAPLIEEVDQQNQSAQIRKHRDHALDAVLMAREMSDDEVLTYYKSRGQSVDMKNIESLRLDLENSASKTPDLFLKGSAVNSETKMRAFFLSAREAHAIKFNRDLYQWEFNDGVKICGASKKIGTSIYKELYNFILANGNKGEAILNAIEEKMNPDKDQGSLDS